MTQSRKTGKLTGFQVRPIGRVRTKIKAAAGLHSGAGSPAASRGIGWQNPLSWRDEVSELVIHKRLVDGLDGLEEYSHIIVYFWSGSDEETLPWQKRFRSKFRPTGRDDFPLVGVLATRSPFRPNPIAATAVELLERKGNVLRVKGLDTFDGTPIIDIKPYIPYYDSIPDAKMADWMMKLADVLMGRDGVVSQLEQRLQRLRSEVESTEQRIAELRTTGSNPVA